MNWYIGQDVVCIETHEYRVVIEDTVYSIVGIINHCHCGTSVDIGASHNFCQREYPKLRCGICKQTFVNDGRYWLHERRFKPLDELEGISEILQIAEQAQPFEV